MQREGTAAAVVMLALDVTTLPGDEVLETIGAPGLFGSGLYLVDQQGQAFTGWNPDLVGRQVANPAALADVPPGQGMEIEDGDPDLLTFAAKVTTLANGGYIVLQQPVS